MDEEMEVERSLTETVCDYLENKYVTDTGSFVKYINGDVDRKAEILMMLNKESSMLRGSGIGIKMFKYMRCVTRRMMIECTTGALELIKEEEMIDCIADAIYNEKLDSKVDQRDVKLAQKGIVNMAAIEKDVIKEMKDEMEEMKKENRLINKETFIEMIKSEIKRMERNERNMEEEKKTLIGKKRIGAMNSEKIKELKSMMVKGKREEDLMKDDERLKTKRIDIKDTLIDSMARDILVDCDLEMTHELDQDRIETRDEKCKSKFDQAKERAEMVMEEEFEMNQYKLDGTKIKATVWDKMKTEQSKYVEAIRDSKEEKSGKDSNDADECEAKNEQMVPIVKTLEMGHGECFIDAFGSVGMTNEEIVADVNGRVDLEDVLIKEFKVKKENEKYGMRMRMMMANALLTNKGELRDTVEKIIIREEIELPDVFEGYEIDVDLERLLQYLAIKNGKVKKRLMKEPRMMWTTMLEKELYTIFEDNGYLIKRKEGYNGVKRSVVCLGENAGPWDFNNFVATMINEKVLVKLASYGLTEVTIVQSIKDQNTGQMRKMRSTEKMHIDEKNMPRPAEGVRVYTDEEMKVRKERGVKESITIVSKTTSEVAYQNEKIMNEIVKVINGSELSENERYIDKNNMKMFIVGMRGGNGMIKIATKIAEIVGETKAVVMDSENAMMVMTQKKMEEEKEKVKEKLMEASKVIKSEIKMHREERKESKKIKEDDERIYQLANAIVKDVMKKEVVKDKVDEKQKQDNVNVNGQLNRIGNGADLQIETVIVDVGDAIKYVIPKKVAEAIGDYTKNMVENKMMKEMEMLKEKIHMLENENDMKSIEIEKLKEIIKCKDEQIIEMRIEEVNLKKEIDFMKRKDGEDDKPRKENKMISGMRERIIDVIMEDDKLLAEAVRKMMK
jgi:hypothetical protein